MQDVQDEPLFVQRAAGLDIAKAEVEVTIRVPSDSAAARRQQETRTFGTTRRQLLDLADWLRSWGVTKAGMEATSDYWKPVFYLLEAAGFETWLVNAKDVKHLPGRPRPGRLDLARQDHRAGHDLLQLRAARADPQAADPHPVPPSPHPGPHRGEAAGGEAARRRPVN